MKAPFKIWVQRKEEREGKGEEGGGAVGNGRKVQRWRQETH
jgi:hypothetical protein